MDSDSAATRISSSSTEYLLTVEHVISLKSLFNAASRLLFIAEFTLPNTDYFQPRAVKACVVSLSRSMFRVILASQNGVLLLGSLKYLHPSWPCQKQPSTNMTVLYFFNTISGDPGSFSVVQAIPKPLAEQEFPHQNLPAWYPCPLMAAIQRLRCSGVITSDILYHSKHKCSLLWRRYIFMSSFLALFMHSVYLLNIRLLAKSLSTPSSIAFSPSIADSRNIGSVSTTWSWSSYPTNVSNPFLFNSGIAFSPHKQDTV